MRKILIALLLALQPSFVEAQNSPGIQTDSVNAVSLDLSVQNNSFTWTIGNGQGVAAIDVTGLNGSGASLVMESSVGGQLWTPLNMLVVGTGGAFTMMLNTDAALRVSTSAKRFMRVRVSTVGTGSAAISASLAANSSIVQFSSPLPTGSNQIGQVGLIGPITLTAPISISNFPSSFSISNFPSSISVSNLPAVQSVSGSVSVSNLPSSWTVGGSVSISNFPAVQPVSGSISISNLPSSQAVTGAFWQALQPVSLASVPLAPGAATDTTIAAMSAKLPASLGPKAASASMSFTPATDAVFTIGNFPSSFSISNLPAIQPVSGTIAVSNFPASFTVSNFPAFPSSFAVSNFPTSFSISNLPATTTVQGTVSVSNLPATQPVSGTFWPATQPVSLASAPLPTGAATDATLLGISAKLPASLGAKTAANSLSFTPATDATFVISNFPSTFGVSNFPSSFAVSNFPTSFSISNFPASQAVTGTFWQVTQPISSAQLPSSLGQKTSAGSVSVAPATDATFTVTDKAPTGLATGQAAVSTTAVLVSSRALRKRIAVTPPAGQIVCLGNAAVTAATGWCGLAGQTLSLDFSGPLYAVAPTGSYTATFAETF